MGLPWRRCAGRLSGTVSPFRAEQGTSLETPSRASPMDCSLPGSSVHGIFQARVLEWVAIAFSTKNMRYSKYSLGISNSLEEISFFSKDRWPLRLRPLQGSQGIYAG